MHCDDMNKTCGGITGGWMRVTSLNMRQASSKCPSSLCLKAVPPRSCRRCSGSLVSSQTYLAGVSYSNVCGRIIAYKFGNPDAYSKLYSNRFDCISVTYGSLEVTIWIFVAANNVHHNPADNICPCMDTRDKRICSIHRKSLLL